MVQGVSSSAGELLEVREAARGILSTAAWPCNPSAGPLENETQIARARNGEVEKVPHLKSYHWTLLSSTPLVIDTSNIRSNYSNGMRSTR